MDKNRRISIHPISGNFDDGFVFCCEKWDEEKNAWVEFDPNEEEESTRLAINHIKEMLKNKNAFEFEVENHPGFKL